MKRIIFYMMIFALCCFCPAIIKADPPANDNCENADDAGTLMAGNTIQLSGTTIDATLDCSMNMEPEVWIRFAMASTMDVTIDFCDEPMIMEMMVQGLFIGCPCEGLVSWSTQNSCDNGNPIFKWNNLAPGTYYFPVSVLSFMQGPYTLNITASELSAPPENDSCFAAIAVGEVVNLPFYTYSATYDGSDTINGGPNIWYVYTPTFTGNALISLCGSSYDNNLVVFDGVGCDPLPSVLGYNHNYLPCGNNAQVVVPVISGNQYLMEIGGDYNAIGNGVLTIAPAVPPENDDCANASDAGTLVSGVGVQLTGNNQLATMDCGAVSYPEVWAKFTITACMDVAIDYCGTIPAVGYYSADLHLYSSCPCGSAITASGIGSCEDGNMSFTWASLVAGTYYYPIILIQGAVGPYILNITGTNCPTSPINDDCENATDAGTIVVGTSTIVTGTNLGTTNDCPVVGHPEAWIKFELTDSMKVKIDYCDCTHSFADYYSGVFDSCPCGSPITSDSSGSCDNYNPFAYWTSLSAGAYWYPVIRTASASGQYVITITGEPFGSSCSYMPGDINGDNQRIGGDVTYGVRYFKGTGPAPLDSCYMDSTGAYLYVSGDVNGNCEFRGSDITRLVAYFKGTAQLSYCHFFPPPVLRNNKTISPKLSGEN